MGRGGAGGGLIKRDSSGLAASMEVLLGEIIKGSSLADLTEGTGRR